MSGEISISIDRQARKWAVFKGFDLVGRFNPYKDEEEALSQARICAAILGESDPEVVYPEIKSLRMSQKRIRKS